MKNILDVAMASWGLNGACATLVATRENKVYHVAHDRGVCALRLHRQGYRSNGELICELQWLTALADGGLRVPRPVASTSGDFLHEIGGVQVSVLSWLDGAPMGRSGQKLNHDNPQTLFFSIGREMARLHQISDDWTVPGGFSRWSWDRDGLLGETPLWGRFWENPALTHDERHLLETARMAAIRDLASREASLDYGLIHADIVRENVMLDGDRVQLIDFDDGGFGFRIFDIATTLIKNMAEPEFETLKAALIDGYRSVRHLDTAPLDLFVMLRAFTYVGWIVPRVGEAGSKRRNRRFIDRATHLAERYLTTRTGHAGS